MKEARIAQVDWRVYVIIDPEIVPEGGSILEVAAEALRGGAGVLQLRDKASSGRVLYERASLLTALCHQHGAIFIVNDRLDIALASGADGVHLGPHDIPCEIARRLAPDLIIGGSAGTVEGAADLVEAGVDYLGVGAVYEARAVKKDASAPQGPELIEAVAEAVSVPVVGIGGITAANAAAVRAAGARGVAVIREVVTSEDPAAAVRSLLEAN